MQSPLEILGSIAVLMARSPHHREMSLDRFRSHCLPAMNAGLAVTASAPVKGEDGRETTAPLGYALFARVSDDWHEKLSDAAFDLTDFPDDAWTSGTHQWLLDMVAAPEAAGDFATSAARAVFAAETDLHVRLHNAEGKMQIGQRTI